MYAIQPFHYPDCELRSGIDQLQCDSVIQRYSLYCELRSGIDQLQ